MLTDAAGQVDEKLGSQYGGYARSAADSVSGFADQVKAKDIDELFDDARELVRKSAGDRDRCSSRDRLRRRATGAVGRRCRLEGLTSWPIH